LIWKECICEDVKEDPFSRRWCDLLSAVIKAADWRQACWVLHSDLATWARVDGQWQGDGTETKTGSRIYVSICSQI